MNSGLWLLVGIVVLLGIGILFYQYLEDEKYKKWILELMPTDGRPLRMDFIVQCVLKDHPKAQEHKIRARLWALAIDGTLGQSAASGHQRFWLKM